MCTRAAVSHANVHINHCNSTCQEINARTAEYPVTDPPCWTALQMLAQANEAGNQSHFVVRLMVMCNADMEARTPSGATALFVAASCGNLLCTFALLHLGASVRVPRRLGCNTKGIGAQSPV